MGSKTIIETNIDLRGGVRKYKCHRQKFFDGDENIWERDETFEESWDLNDSNMPDWLRQYL